MAPKVVQLSYEQWLIDMAGGAPPSPQMHQMYLIFVKGQGYAPKYVGGGGPETIPDIVPGPAGGPRINVDPSVGFKQTPEQLWEKTPFASQWLERLQGMGVAGQGLYGANPAEAYARSAWRQREPEYQLHSLSQGLEASPFMQWQPGADRAMRQQTAAGDWQSLTGRGGDPTGTFAQMQDPTAGGDFKPYEVYNMALSAQQGYMPPFMRQMQRNQAETQYNRWRQQGAAQGGGLSFADYLTRELGLGR